MTGSSVISSISCLVAIPEWYDVPHAMRIIRRHLFISLIWSTFIGLLREVGFDYCRRKIRIIIFLLDMEWTVPKPPSTTRSFSKITRPRIVFTTDSGCSKISFCMNEEKFPFMICWSSNSNLLMSREVSFARPSLFLRRWRVKPPSRTQAVSSS